MSSVVSDVPATDYVTTLLVRRWDGRYVPEGRTSTRGSGGGLFESNRSTRG